VIAAIQADPGRPPTFSERELYQAIWQRHTDRGPFTAEPISESQRAALEQAASSEHATLRMLTNTDAATVLDMSAVAGVELAGDADHQVELQRWIAAGTEHDGIPASALPPPPSREPAPVRADLARASPAVTGPTATYEDAPQLAVLTTAGDEVPDWLRAGQALQRVLLTATSRGLSTSFLYQAIQLRDMRRESAPAWPWDENPQMVIRFGYGKDTSATPRRPVDDVLSRAAATHLC
jgi:hypothetical protein